MPYSDQDLAPKAPKLPKSPPPPHPTQDEVLGFLAQHYDGEKPWHTAIEISVGLKRSPPLVDVFASVLRIALKDVLPPEKRESQEEIRAQMTRLMQHLEKLVEERLVERRESPDVGVVYRTTLRGWSRRPRA